MSEQKDWLTKRQRECAADDIWPASLLLQRADAIIRDLQENLAKARKDALIEARDWCAAQASALHKLKRDDEQRRAFVEAANAILKIALADKPKEST